MNDSIGKAFSEIMVLLSIVISLAIVAVLVGKNAKTADVLKEGGSAFADIIKAAVSPVS